MRVVQIFDAIFWGGLLVTAGVLLITGNVTSLKIPWWRILVALFFLYIGVHVLLGGFSSAPKGSAIMTDAKIAYSADVKEYNAIFGNSEFDLSTFAENESATRANISAIFGYAVADLTKASLNANAKIEANGVFGKLVIKLPKGTPYSVAASSAFGRVTTPKGASVSFGDLQEVSDAGGPYRLMIKASGVFGGVEIIEE